MTSGPSMTPDLNRDFVLAVADAESRVESSCVSVKPFHPFTDEEATIPTAPLPGLLLRRSNVDLLAAPKGSLIRLETES